MSASNLTSGTVPDARFPATLPAASAANLTSIPAANITGTLPAISGANLTGISAFVSGMIIIWSGAEAAIPSGWVICDGNNSTPNLRARFVMGGGSGSGYSIGDTGGAASVTLTIAQIPSHSHTFNRGAYSGGTPAPANRTQQSETNTTGSTGGGQSHENRPPYYVLCYIMKT